MDTSMYILDIAVAVVLCGLILFYNIHTRNEIRDMQIQKTFDATRYFGVINVAAIIYAVLAIVGLTISVYVYTPAHWITMILLAAFMAVDLVRALLRAHKLKQQGRQGSRAAAFVAPRIQTAGIMMMVYMILQIINLFYFV